MQVHHRHIKKICLATELPKMRHDIAVGNLRALFHHLAELAGQLEAPVQGVDLGRFDTECCPAHRCPCESRDHPPAALGTLGFESRLTENVFNLSLTNAHPLGVFLHHFQNRRSYQ